MAAGGHWHAPVGNLRLPPGCPRRHLALRGGAGRDRGSVGSGSGGGGEDGEEGGTAINFDPVSMPLIPARACGARNVRWMHGRGSRRRWPPVTAALLQNEVMRAVQDLQRRVPTDEEVAANR